MDREAIRTHCLSLPHVTEQLQWGADLLYKIGGKMFVVTNMAPEPVALSMKASPERFYELLERAGVRPAPYLARAQWVHVDAQNDLSWSELKELIAESYALVRAKLPKRLQGGEPAETRGSKKPAKRRPTPKPTTKKTRKKTARKKKAKTRA